jgi:hypothetical protein
MVVLAAILMAASCASALGREPGFAEYRAVQESLSSVPPKWRGEWLRARGIDWPGYTSYRQPDSGQGLRLVGKYGRGRSWEVDGQDSLVALALGSEVALLSLVNPDQPVVLSETQLDYMPAQVAVRGTLMLTGRNGIDLWHIADPTAPALLSHVPFVVSGFAVSDSFLYFVSGDSFYSYNIARPATPDRLGACRDSGYVATATPNVAVLLTRDILAFIDVSNPAAPHRSGSFSGYPLAAQARGNLCCATFTNPSQPSQSQFVTINISDPTNPAQLASLSSVCGVGLSLEGQYAFTSGRANYEPMRIVDISDSAHPVVTGQVGLPSSGEGWGTWADLSRNRAYVAWDYCGLQVIDITNVSAPFLDTALLVADQALDIVIDSDRACVADNRAGLRVLDVSNPATPYELGGYDSIGRAVESHTVVAKDSFAFVGWWPRPQLRVMSLADPLNPVQVAACSVPSIPEDMVLRDTLLYAAGRLRFYVVNVARPREPVLVGSCVLPGSSGNISLADTIAWVTNLGLYAVSVANPASPRVIGSWSGQALGVKIADSTAYVSCAYCFVTLNVANPVQPVTLDSIWLNDFLFDVAVIDTLAYAGGNRLHVFDISNPGDLREVSSWAPPYTVNRLCYDGLRLYAACYDAGVCVLETTAVGVTEPRVFRPPRWALNCQPNPTRGRIAWGLAGLNSARGTWTLRDVTGRSVRQGSVAAGVGRLVLDLTSEPTGVYIVELEVARLIHRARVVKL